MKYLISCEHAHNAVPAAYRDLFDGRRPLLDSHRGRDKGAGELAEALGRALRLPVYQAPYTRLLIDVNRSLTNRRTLFSSVTRSLPRSARQKIIDEIYHPYVEMVRENIEKLMGDGETVLHLSVHSFTPELNGKIRNADIGLLYVPGLPEEKAFCHRLREEIRSRWSGCRIRFNYPYTGVSDGLQTYFHRLFPAAYYLAVTIELNQALFSRYPADFINGVIADSLEQIIH